MAASVSLSVPRWTKSRMEWRGKLKIGVKQAHDTSDTWPHLEVERSKVKVTRPINAEKEKVSYQISSQGEKTDKLQTWNRGGVQLPASPTCVVTSNVKGQGYNVTSSVWHVFAHNSTKWSGRNTKIGGKTVRAPADIRTSSNVKRSKVKIANRSGWLFKVTICSGGHSTGCTAC